MIPISIFIICIVVIAILSYFISQVIAANKVSPIEVTAISNFRIRLAYSNHLVELDGAFLSEGRLEIDVIETSYSGNYLSISTNGSEYTKISFKDTANVAELNRAAKEISQIIETIRAQRFMELVET